MATSRRINNVAIVGVGMIGGSIGMALRRRGIANQVVGIGQRQSTLRIARQRGAISSSTVNLKRGVSEADLVVICTPVRTIPDLVCATAEAAPPGALITDAGSTKTDIVQKLKGRLGPGARYLGSHPLAGSEQSGPQNADASLLEGRTVIVTPTRGTDSTDRRRLKRFWNSLGARVAEMTPSEHDRCVAAISHLPHLVATALASSTANQELPFAASGWMDTTRVASGDVDMWIDILKENRDHVLKSARRFEKLMGSLCNALQRNDTRTMRRILQDAKQKRDSIM
ncbi:MAG: prephenate dehydrogenase/arogenate dehydrogenase family protein [Planctomycetales bacterium]